MGLVFLGDRQLQHDDCFGWPWKYYNIWSQRCNCYFRWKLQIVHPNQTRIPNCWLEEAEFVMKWVGLDVIASGECCQQGQSGWMGWIFMPWLPQRYVEWAEAPRNCADGRQMTESTESCCQVYRPCWSATAQALITWREVAGFPQRQQAGSMLAMPHRRRFVADGAVFVVAWRAKRSSASLQLCMSCYQEKYWCMCSGHWSRFPLTCSVRKCSSMFRNINVVDVLVHFFASRPWWVRWIRSDCRDEKGLHFPSSWELLFWQSELYERLQAFVSSWIAGHWWIWQEIGSAHQRKLPTGWV